MSNKQLSELYERVYEQGSDTFYTFPATNEMFGVVEMGRDLWRGASVLEIGCGEGNLAAILGMAGARVLAIDYAQSAIDIANERFRLPDVEYRCQDYHELDGRFDAVVLQGTLEHTDDPFGTLDELRTGLLEQNGTIITSSPSFLNPRGHVWMALLKLLDVPMSLSDKHYLTPVDFEQYAQEHGLPLRYTSTDQDWGHGERLIYDFNKRLRNALRDAKLDANVDAYLEWLHKTIGHTAYTESSGANVVYRLDGATG